MGHLPSPGPHPQIPVENLLGKLRPKEGQALALATTPAKCSGSTCLSLLAGSPHWTATAQMVPSWLSLSSPDRLGLTHLLLLHELSPETL